MVQPPRGEGVEKGPLGRVLADQPRGFAGVRRAFDAVGLGRIVAHVRAASVSVAI